MHLTQDGEEISLDIERKFKLGRRDIRYNRKRNTYVFDFVGLIVSNEDILIVFPKHMYDLKGLNYLSKDDVSEEDITLIFQSIKKYLLDGTKNPEAINYSGRDDAEFDSSFPFYSFHKIYEYYEKYGLFFKKKSIISKGETGKLHWKSIIEKSSPFISGNNIIFSPLYYKKNLNENNYVTAAMAYVINTTKTRIPFLFQYEFVTSNLYQEGEFENSQYVIANLSAILNHTFKDIDVELIENLILFFEENQDNFAGHEEHVKIRYFNNIWESMVGCYLNRYFEEIKLDGEVIFSPIIISRSTNFFTEKVEQIDISGNKWSIKMDHYHEDENQQLIFDSKYYSDEKALNYKQLAYHETLIKKYRKKYKKTNSVLIFPGNKPQMIHYRINPSIVCKDQSGRYLLQSDDVIIWSLYLDVRTVMEKYIK